MQSIHKAYCSQVAPQQSLFPLRLYVYKGTMKLKKSVKKLWKNLDYNIEGCSPLSIKIEAGQCSPIFYWVC